jgi:hypothetical protein
VLVAYLTLTPSGWAAAATLLQQSAPTTKRISVVDARALLPPPLFASLPSDGTRVELTGPALDPRRLETALYHPTVALRIGDGIYAAFYTR